MSKNQSVSSIIFEEVVNRTSTKSPSLQQFESKKHKHSMLPFWRRLIVVLEIDLLTELEALRILWKLTTKDLKVTRALLFKLSAVCLLLAQKLNEDETHSVQSISLVTGIPIKQITALEVEVLCLLDFRLMSSCEQLRELPRELHSKIYQVYVQQ